MKINRPTIQTPAAPRGLWDILPAQAAERRALEGRLRAAFERREYGEVISPSFEYYDNLAVEAGTSIQGDMVRFMGTDGRLLALRPEMTTAIARVTAQRLDPKDEPHRLYYVANVFREHPSKRGQPREFWQAGVEQIGGGTVAGDIEVVTLFIEALTVAGLKDFKVGLGRIDFLSGILGTLDIAGADEESLRGALASRSLVEYERVVLGLALEPEARDDLLALPALSGGAGVLDRAAELAAGTEAAAVVAELRQVYAGLAEAGVAERIILDLGIVRDFDYYTGMIFEAYTPSLGAVIGGGGRYDDLLAEFGYQAPAAGFAVGLERLERALAAGGVV